MTASSLDRKRRLSGVIPTIYTDGACSPNPGAGGWAWWISDSEWGSGAEPESTNNVMELRAVIEALRAMPLDQPVEIASDSSYVVKCFTDRWHVSWRKNGWKKSDGKPVQNLETWRELLDLVDQRTANTKWRLVPGHSGLHGNERADRLAVDARLSLTTAPTDPADLTVAAARGLLARAIEAKGEDYVYVTPQGAEGSVYFGPDGEPSCLIGHLLHFLGFGPGDVPEGSNVWTGLRDVLPAEAGVIEGLDCAQSVQDDGRPWGEALDAFDAGVAITLAEAAA